MTRPLPDFDVTVVLRVGDDEERIGHVVGRLARHLRALGQRFEILVADEGSGDNTCFVAAVLRTRTFREIELLHAEPQRGFEQACARARGRTVVLYDARVEAPLSTLGFALERVRDGADVVAVHGRYLVLRRTRAWRAFDALVGRRDPLELERRFLRRARSLGLQVATTEPTRSATGALRRWLRFATLVPARS